jgi:hypothetical protein
MGPDGVIWTVGLVGAAETLGRGCRIALVKCLLLGRGAWKGHAHPPPIQESLTALHPPNRAARARPLAPCTAPQVPNEAAVCFRERFEAWKELGNVRVEVTTRGFGDAFDGDMSLLYDPDSTAAIILGEGGWSGGAHARARLCMRAHSRVCERVYVYVGLGARMRVCVCVCVCVCMCVHVGVCMCQDGASSAPYTSRHNLLDG